MNYHTPVLLNETILGLSIIPGGIYIDCTLGGGGHSFAILENLTTGKLFSIDQDINAINNAKKLYALFPNSFKAIHSNFSDSDYIFDEIGGQGFNGILMDLGVSSSQLDEGSLGFSYNHDAPLDMRMDVRNKLSAYDVVNDYTENELAHIIYEYGEERWAKRIAEFIALERQKKPINTTFELVSIIKMAIPKKARQDGPHPAKRTFQAIRIEVNSELSILPTSIKNYANALVSGGRICIITFHSLEDRIVKNTFKTLANPCECPRDLPFCICKKQPTLKIITNKPIKPSEKELEANPRARSAKLRIAERV